MIILNLRTYINRNYITSEHLQPTDMIGYMDAVIDDINDDLQATFPTFSEWSAFCAAHNDANPESVPLDPNNYTAFPDTYLRKVVAPGAALKFYANDEEGEQVASKFYLDYEKARATMVRDYMNQVPTIFQDNTGGFVEFKDNLDPVGMEMYYENSSL